MQSATCIPHTSSVHYRRMGGGGCARHHLIRQHCAELENNGLLDAILARNKGDCCLHELLDGVGLTGHDEAESAERQPKAGGQ